MIYTPRHFAGSDHKALISKLVEQYNFATMITIDHGRPVVSHLPFVFLPDEGPQGTLIAHMARANPQSALISAGCESWVIFQGPHAYISSSWYQPQPDNVPTWNYAVVHMSGIPKVVGDEALAFAEMLLLIERNDPTLNLNLTAKDRQGLLKAITVFKIEVATLDVKFKMSQNRSPEDRASIVRQLVQGGEEQRATAAFMQSLD